MFYRSDEDPYSSGFESIKFFDLFTGGWFDGPLSGLTRRGDAEVEISPDLSRIIYDSLYENQAYGVILKGLYQETPLWTVEGFYPFPRLEAFIEWAPDSAWVSVTNSGIKPQKPYFKLISRDGDMTIDLDAIWPTDAFNIGDASWSTDSRFLAFTIGEVIPSLYIFDIKERRFVYTCPFPAFQYHQPSLIWSPDNTFIGVSSSYSEDPVQVISISTGIVYDLGEKARIIGWSRFSW